MNKYQEIAQIIQDKIEDGSFEENSFLPSQRELMTHYKVTRDTIRSALQLLADQGLIEILPNKGSRVKQQNILDFFISDSSGIRQKKNFHQLQPDVLSLEELTVDEELNQRSGFTIGDTVWCLIRRRLLKGVAIILEKDYILESAVPDLTMEIAQQSLYQYFEKDLQLKLSSSRIEISVEKTSPLCWEMLDLNKSDTKLIVARNWAYLDDFRHFQYSESYHQTDSTKFVLVAKHQT